MGASASEEGKETRLAPKHTAGEKNDKISAPKQLSTLIARDLIRHRGRPVVQRAQFTDPRGNVVPPRPVLDRQ
jgi:hypothetical protein